MTIKSFTGNTSLLLKLVCFMATIFAVDVALAQDLGGISSTVYSNFAQLSKLITAGAYIAGLGFSLAAIMKFKGHKDNPTQVPIGTPVALVMVAAALLFLPSILGVTGETVFSDGGTVATSTGTAWTPSGG